MTSQTKIDAATDALVVLSDMWESDETGYKLPVDPIRIAGNYGIAVYEDDFPPRISGAIVSTHEKGPIILLNKNDPKQRRRFTCAHEIGHYIKRMSSNSEDAANFEYIDLRGTLSSEGTNDDEIFANEFAASLLMPADQVKSLAKKYSLPQLVDIFKVSRDAMTFRLKNLNITQG